jgi:hypothetical protein
MAHPGRVAREGVFEDLEVDRVGPALLGQHFRVVRLAALDEALLLGDVGRR